MGLQKLSFDEIFEAPGVTNPPAGSKSARAQALYATADDVDLWVGIVG